MLVVLLLSARPAEADTGMAGQPGLSAALSRAGVTVVLTLKRL